MSIVKEINELHISLRSLLLSIICIMPFWYLSFFVLENTFAKSSNIHIQIILSFCLSTCYFAVNFLTTVLLQSSFKKYSKDDPVQVGTFIISLFFSLFWVSILLFIGYYCDWKLLSYIKITFLVSIIHTMVFLLLNILFSPKNQV